ncbi:copper-containing nitrite reductase [Trinickia caryophylli]|uniref:Copper-containing nitrite reductase n=1 Tax=Trinickia caryophylli TaxID=28094 RepID=A0A1X7FX87_TRICW|nr:copper-containing nitrite reductase [Trinickia caryophylli]PMS11810.1 nitrite reductase, copper-containing [Trinickia caryophylli]TRX17492.1 nitrite reductase, copper-containing [Trinickia caryophylli]WQE11762.1 copper-containing nitrite reductase [Trinickia caryophylli]SMF59669.1 dissimilatory nitrite reductase (NO-forming), copper type apoprotein [Trinickia caryophylli]GLU34740.1 hypothetical protein Busp01_45820 [Trinickia caryophylli]
MFRFRLTAVCAAILMTATFSTASLAADAAAGQAGAVQTAAAKGKVKHFVLRTNIVDGKMAFVDESGKPNPVLKANVGDTVEISLASGEGAEHDIAIPDLNVASKRFSGASGPSTVRFVAKRAGEFTYFCTVAGHRPAGMEGKLEVSGTALASAHSDVGGAAPAAEHGEDGHTMKIAYKAAPPAATQPADPTAVDVVQDPSTVPAPIGDRAPQTLKYRIDTVELAGRLDDGTTFTYWTFNGKVPGPMLRARVGDTVELTLANSRTSKMIHSIDLHAVIGGMGGGKNTQVAPGQEKTITFKVAHPGLFVYHCATPLVPEHISAGMYGMILVEPEGGLPKVDREYYVMQGEMYTSHAFGTHGHETVDLAKLSSEQPEYYVFNGAVGSLTKTHKLVANVGETVRIFFGVGGPNKMSSFHVIGGVFDTVYDEASLSARKHDVQTTVVPPGGAAIVEMKMQYPGNYVLVDHALSRAGRGLAGILEVKGNADPAVYQVSTAH